jgi:hypothetical protein
MGFWDTFVRVWQIRTSVRIQQGIEKSLSDIKRSNELHANMPIILNELEKKNDIWEEKYKQKQKTYNEK